MPAETVLGAAGVTLRGPGNGGSVIAEAPTATDLAEAGGEDYVFNDFNNTHEGDWEMVQVVFRAPDARSALRVEPEELGYAQHSGGERAVGSDSRVEREGLHPLVYVAAGSHASFFGPGLYLGRSAELVRGRWWSTAATMALINAVGLASGPVVGIVLLFVSDLPLLAINLVGSAVYAVTVPYVAIATTLLWGDRVTGRVSGGRG